MQTLSHNIVVKGGMKKSENVEQFMFQPRVLSSFQFDKHYIASVSGPNFLFPGVAGFRNVYQFLGVNEIGVGVNP